MKAEFNTDSEYAYLSSENDDNILRVKKEELDVFVSSWDVNSGRPELNIIDAEIVMEECKTLDELIENYKAIKKPTHYDTAKFMKKFIDVQHPKDGMVAYSVFVAIMPGTMSVQF